MSGHSSTKLTYADYLRFPDDGLRHEIIEGEHYVTPSPSMRHQRISGRLFNLIQNHLGTHPTGGEVFFGPFDVLLSEFNILEPDVVYISAERARIITLKNVQGAPDLVVEILSPSTKSRDLRLKRDVYERTGVEEYWVVDPDNDVVEVHRRIDSTFAPSIQHRRGELLTTPLLPGLKLPLDKILA